MDRPVERTPVNGRGLLQPVLEEGRLIAVGRQDYAGTVADGVDEAVAGEAVQGFP
jgi:hypothetical protein